MANDRRFEKNRIQRQNELKRRAARRAPYDRVLIVTEGEETEPNYFREIIQARKLNTANVEVVGKCGSAPKSVLERAMEIYSSVKDPQNKFARVYCVFDRDHHPSYQSTICAINHVQPSNVFHAINSVPCFEYWILLHFEYTTRAYQTPVGQSACKALMSDYPKVFSNYKKGQKGLFKWLEDKTEFAIENARQSLKVALKNTPDENPSTKIHIVVHDLYTLKGG